jgi:hypothetical protein
MDKISYVDCLMTYIDLCQAPARNRREPVEERILQRLQSEPVTSLFQLAVVDLGITYSWAWTVVRRMERNGQIEIRRGSHGSLRISLKEDRGEIL